MFEGQSIYVASVTGMGPAACPAVQHGIRFKRLDNRWDKCAAEKDIKITSDPQPAASNQWVDFVLCLGHQKHALVIKEKCSEVSANDILFTNILLKFVTMLWFCH